MNESSQSQPREIQLFIILTSSLEDRPHLYNSSGKLLALRLHHRQLHGLCVEVQTTNAHINTYRSILRETPMPTHSH